MRRALALFLVSQAVVFAAVWAQSYQGRVTLRYSQVQGCVRGRLDRVDNASSWGAQRTADIAVAHDRRQPARTRRARHHAAHVHGRTVAGLRSRIVDCHQAFPPPSFFPHL